MCLIRFFLTLFSCLIFISHALISAVVTGGSFLACLADLWCNVLPFSKMLPRLFLPNKSFVPQQAGSQHWQLVVYISRIPHLIRAAQAHSAGPRLYFESQTLIETTAGKRPSLDILFINCWYVPSTKGNANLHFC